MSVQYLHRKIYILLCVAFSVKQAVRARGDNRVRRRDLADLVVVKLVPPPVLVFERSGVMSALHRTRMVVAHAI